MDLLSQDEDVGSFCSSCNLRFGTVRDTDGKIRCPVCKKAIDEKSVQVEKVGHLTYLCHICNLRFGAVPEDGKPVKCPICQTV